MKGKTPVVIGSREPITALGLREACTGHADLHVAGTGVDLAAVLAATLPLEAPLAIVDPTLLGVMPEVAVRALAQAGAQPLLLVDDDAVDALPALLRAGARGCVSRSASVDGLVDAARTVAAGRVALSGALQREVTARLLDLHDETPHLSSRERRVLGLVGDGLSSAQIGVELHVSERTVKTHLQRAGSKLGTQGRAATAMRAQRLGLLQT